jgi:DNA repair protein RecO (recombination protein O)
MPRMPRQGSADPRRPHRQTPADGRAASDAFARTPDGRLDHDAFTLELEDIPLAAHQADLDPQTRARAHEAPVLERTHTARNQGHSSGRIAEMPGKAARCLNHCFKHHHAREDRERREVILEVLLGQRDLFERHDTLRTNFQNSIYQVEPHEAEDMQRAGLAPWPYLQLNTIAGVCPLFAALPPRICMPTANDQAICIRQWDWSETSQTVWMFARTLGMVHGIAKGSKRERSRFSGGIQPLTRGEITLILKPGAELVMITAWDLQEMFPALRRSLPAFYCGMYMADLLQHSVTERDPHPALFDALARSLRLLDEPGMDRVAVLLFQWATLVETGYRPELDVEILSGQPLPKAETYIFLPASGGFMPHAAEVSASTGRPAGPQWRVRSSTLDLLRLVAAAGDPAEFHRLAPHDAPQRAARLLAYYLREILGRDLPSASLLFQDRQP